MYSFPTTAKSVKDFESPEVGTKCQAAIEGSFEALYTPWSQWISSLQNFLDLVKPILGENVWAGKTFPVLHGSVKHPKEVCALKRIRPARVLLRCQVLLHAAAGKSRSEGGFQVNQVSKASVLKLAEEKGPNGKDYIRAHVLTNTGGQGLFAWEIT